MCLSLCSSTVSSEVHKSCPHTSGLNMSRRIRRTPFTNKVEECGVTGFSVVNHMLLPKAFKKSVEEDYWHLRSNVQLWDVSVQRQVQIEGPDAENLVQRMTPRSIKGMKVKKCFYIPIIDENAGMINDPVLLKLSENKFWLSTLTPPKNSFPYCLTSLTICSGELPGAFGCMMVAF